MQQLLDAGATTTTLNRAGLRPVDLIVGARAETPLGKELIQMLTMTQAENALGADDIAYGTYYNDSHSDDDDIEGEVSE